MKAKRNTPTRCRRGRCTNNHRNYTSPEVRDTLNEQIAKRYLSAMIVCPTLRSGARVLKSCCFKAAHEKFFLSSGATLCFSSPLRRCLLYCLCSTSKLLV